MQNDHSMVGHNSRAAGERGAQLARQVEQEYGTTDVYEIARRANVRVEYRRWPLVTVGEFDRRSRTISVNLAALEKSASEKQRAAEDLARLIVAHELGHFFDSRLNRGLRRGISQLWSRRQRSREMASEQLAHSFAATLLRLPFGIEQVESLWRS